ncbi:MAG: PH domain-containing protein [Opitutaceae bacterium]|nr:PH domain-containing protein [Opitutaceae bacterium]
MFNLLRRLVLRVARLPANPTPPVGAPGSTQVFRAAKNYYLVRLARWLLGQLGAVIGIAVSLWFLNQLDTGVKGIRQLAAEAPAIQSSAEASPNQNPAPASSARLKQDRDFKRIAQKISRWPTWTLRLIHWAEYAAIALFLAQLPITLAAVRLEYEQHWYIVTDRSLRIRTGLFRLQESTMSFANLQQVEVHQGPLQRLLDIADVRVRSAGGGHAESSAHGGSDLHHAVFHGVANAPEIRDLILARLKHFREAGLGDPDDLAPLPHQSTALTAAQTLLGEVRALRQSFRV